MELLSSSMQFFHRLAGVDPPPLQHSPILARSAGEFWAQRWNSFVSGWLNAYVFRPLARRHHPVWGMFTAFVVSAVLHFWVATLALGLLAGISMGLYFVIEGVIVLGERSLALQSWPLSLARTWMILVVLCPAILGIEPFLRVFGL
jgi:hypothetical protein